MKQLYNEYKTESYNNRTKCIFQVKMCCNKPLQAQAKLVGSISLIVSIFVVIFLQMTLFLCSSNDGFHSKDGHTILYHKKADFSNKPTKSCNIRLDKKYEYNYVIVISISTIFLVIFDIPSSMLLLWGSKLKLRSYIIPWLIVNGFKAMIIIPVFVVIAWCVHMHVQDNIAFYSQAINRNKNITRFHHR